MAERSCIVHVHGASFKGDTAKLCGLELTGAQVTAFMAVSRDLLVSGRVTFMRQ